MSGIMPGAFITFDGEPITGRVPPRLIVRDNPMINDQHNAVKHLYQEFARHNGLSLAGYHVNEARLSDGTRVRMESNNGVDRVTVWPGRSGYEALFDIRPLALFASLDAPFGVWPGPPVFAPGAVSATPTASLWSNPPLVRAQDLEFSHGYRATFDSQNPLASFPGTMDWYDDRGIESPNFGLVITWWPKYPHRYGWELQEERDFSDADLSKRQSIGLADAEFKLFYITERLVWCNGIRIAALPLNHAVEGACLHTRNDGSTVLRVIASSFDYYYIYEGPYQREKPPRASQIDLITLTQTHAIYRGDGRLLHPAHCNDTGTRAVMVIRTPMESGEYLWELDLGAGSMTAVKVPWEPESDEDFEERSELGIGTYEKTRTGYHHFDKNNASGEWVEHHVIAADYCKGSLEYVYRKDTHDLLIDSSSSYDYKNELQPYADALTSIIASHSQETVIDHSAIGELSKYTYGFTESISRSTVYDDNDRPSRTRSITNTFTGDIPGKMYRFGLTGDLRVRSFDLTALYHNTAHRYRNFTVTEILPLATRSDISMLENGTPQRIYADRTRYINGIEISRLTAIYMEKEVEVASLTPSVDVGFGRYFTYEMTLISSVYSVVYSAYDKYASFFIQRINGPWEKPKKFPILTYWGYGEALMIRYKNLITDISTDGKSSYYLYRVSTERRTTPPAENSVAGTMPICATSSFDGSLYYMSSIDWPADGTTPDDENGVVDAERLLFNAKIYNTKTGEELVDLNADPNLNPCPGLGKTCTTMLFLGPVRDPKGRYNDCPTYLMKPE